MGWEGVVRTARKMSGYSMFCVNLIWLLLFLIILVRAQLCWAFKEAGKESNRATAMSRRGYERVAPERYRCVTNLRDIGWTLQAGEQGVLPPTGQQKGILDIKSPSTPEKVFVDAEEAGHMLQVPPSTTRPAELAVCSPFPAGY